MNVSPMGALTGVEPPPFRLPGSHFAVALGFLVLGAVGLVLVSADLAAGAYLAPRVTGVTHLFTLGWISTSIMGALYQLLPVALEQEIRWPRGAQATLVLWAPGLLVFVAGLVTLHPVWTVAGASALATAVVLFCTNMTVTLRGASRRDLTWWALALATGFLALTAVVGGALAVNLRWAFMGPARLPALGSHIHIALVGWVLMVMVGVGHRLLPMFLLSHGADERPGRWAVGLLGAGAFLVFSLHHAPPPWSRWVSGPVILAGVGAFLLQAHLFFRTSKRPSLDAGMRVAGAGLVVLAAAAVLGAFQAVTGFARPHLATGYVAALVLGITLFVAGHYYKILPFLVWYHRFGPLAGKRPLPRVADLYSARGASVAGTLLAAGVAALVLGMVTGTEAVTRAGAGAFLAGTLVETVQMAAISTRRPR